MMVSSSGLVKSLLSVALVVGAAYAVPLDQRDTKLPIVDLGYELHQPTFNETGRYYNFSNIRYAAPPVGDLRWRAPQAPAEDRSKINDGSISRICPQANPGWETTASNFIVSRLLGLNYTGGDGVTSSATNITLPAQSPASSEDCLFLDVVVPQNIFESKNAKAPVLVWIYGGGYTAGQKAGNSPSGLLERSEAAPTTGGVIYVAMNYRLGAFGWLSGEEVGKDGVANAGLYDQRFALEWVQKNIHLFGGDRDRVTVFGESAGGGSIVHQITAYGHKDECSVTPFQQAIIQSPGWDPAVSAAEQEATYKNLLDLLNVTSLAEARKVSSEALILASYTQIYKSTYGTFTYGPVTDGVFVPKQPATLLAEGSFDHSIKVMVGHNAQEGLLFTPPSSGSNNTSLEGYLRTSLETASQEVLDYISNTLYPPVFDGSQGYTDNVGRAVKAVSEYVFVCNTFYLDLAYDNKTYAYNFDVPPALHGQDIGYTYFTGNENTPNAQISAFNPYAVTNVTVAITLQEFITSFAQTGKPVAKEGTPVFEVYGEQARAEILNQTGISIGLDSAANERCRWWQKQLYLPTQ